MLDEEHYIAMTWLDKTFMIINRDTLAIESEEAYPPEFREGWGITHSDKYLYLTDGSHFIYILDPKTRHFIRKFPVTT